MQTKKAVLQRLDLDFQSKLAGERVRMTGFRLQKWYLDAADERGNVYIGYWGSVSWKDLNLSFFQHLWRPANGAVHSRAGLEKRPAPRQIDETTWRWDTPEVSAEWRSLDREGLAEQLLATDQGEIRWECMQPKASVTIDSEELSFRGWGYTERMDLSIVPWKLPLKTLHWGRCHSEHHYLVWVKWDGPSPRNVLWHNGVRTEQFQASERGVASPEVQFLVDESQTLRQDVLRSTLADALGKTAALFPRQAFMLKEHKHYGRGRLVSAGASEFATAIYEEVLW